MHIRELFDPSKDIYRTIEKVISYGAAQEDRLRAEVAEYIVTESIDEQLVAERSDVQAAMELQRLMVLSTATVQAITAETARLPERPGAPGPHGIEIDGQIDRLASLLGRCVLAWTRHDPAQTEMHWPAGLRAAPIRRRLAGATLEVVSTVLYYKVAYLRLLLNPSDDDAFERMLFVIRKRMDNEIRAAGYDKTAYYVASMSSRTINYKGMLLAGQVGKYYLDLQDERFASAHDSIYLMKDRVAEILDIVREYTGDLLGKGRAADAVEVFDPAAQSGVGDVLLGQRPGAEALGQSALIGTAQAARAVAHPAAEVRGKVLHFGGHARQAGVQRSSHGCRWLRDGVGGHRRCRQRRLGDRSPDRQHAALRHNTRLKDAKFRALARLEVARDVLGRRAEDAVEILLHLLDKHAARLDRPMRLVMTAVVTLDKLSPALIAEGRDELRELGKAGATCNRYLAALSKALNMGALDWNDDLAQYELLSDGASRGQFQQWLRGQAAQVTRSEVRNLFVRRGIADCNLMNPVATDFGTRAHQSP